MTTELKVKKRGGMLDYNSLVIMGLLYCQDRRTPFTKAKELFNLLQEGGSNEYTFISVNDKDWRPALDLIFRLCCVLTVEAAGQMPLYVDDIRDIQGKFDQVSGYDEEGDGATTFFDLVYGENGKITYEKFVEKVSQKAAWIFKPALIRKKVWNLAQVELKHID